MGISTVMVCIVFCIRVEATIQIYFEGVIILWEIDLPHREIDIIDLYGIVLLVDTSGRIIMLVCITISYYSRLWSPLAYISVNPPSILSDILNLSISIPLLLSLFLFLFYILNLCLLDILYIL